MEKTRCCMCGFQLCAGVWSKICGRSSHKRETSDLSSRCVHTQVHLTLQVPPKSGAQDVLSAGDVLNRLVNVHLETPHAIRITGKTSEKIRGVRQVERDVVLD